MRKYKEDLVEDEMDVFQLLSIGKSQKEIASHLNLSQCAIGKRITRGAKRLGAISTIQAVLILERKGLLK